MAKTLINIALVGNPNCGKTSLFNVLTGLNQKVGNFPGVTVDKKTGHSELEPNLVGNIIDLPGTYSLYPRRADEWVAYRVLMNADPEIKPDMVLLVADASNLKRNLLFCSQILDLKIPIVVALTMTDIARRKGIEIDVPGLERDLGVPVVSINARSGKGVSVLKKALTDTARMKYVAPKRDFIENRALASTAVGDVQKIVPALSDYASIHYLINHEHFPLDAGVQDQIEETEKRNKFNHTKTQAEEIMQRYGRIKQIMQQNVVEPDPLQQKLFTEKLDNLLLHRVWGYLILLCVLFFLFQSIFWLAQYPMMGIEWMFAEIGTFLEYSLPAAWWSDLITNGFVAGLSGILVFIPQIMILFGLITILEDTGYMARISFLTDKLMRKTGLNGKSVMPMIGGFACAVPAIMSARNIENKKERLLTILVTPFMSCSARLPVFTILIALVIPDIYYFGFLSLQGLIMMALYLFGVVVALLVAGVLKICVNLQEKSFFILELPIYRAPRWKNVGVTMVEKAKVFVRDAGKIIMVISLVLWFLSSYGPTTRMEAVHKSYEQRIASAATVEEKTLLEKEYGTAKLENSFAGLLGKSIEPAIEPLGYDWKIGIALITSFAAREVFVGTMATLYSVEEDDNTSLRSKMQSAVRPDGSKVYTLGTAVSLMLFYLLAMQCMSTMAVVKRETRGWKWPIIQFCFMTAIAYLASMAAFQILG